MPLTPDVGANIKELRAENKRRRAGKSSGKPRPRRQVIAIALAAARRFAQKK